VWRSKGGVEEGEEASGVAVGEGVEPKEWDEAEKEALDGISKDILNGIPLVIKLVKERDVKEEGGEGEAE
jgi:hypothetical protein